MSEECKNCSVPVYPDSINRTTKCRKCGKDGCQTCIHGLDGICSDCEKEQDKDEQPD